MARLVSAKCPNCGAKLRLDPKLDFVTCSYCSTSALLERSDRPRGERPDLPVIVVPGPSRAGLVAVLAATGALMLIGLVAIAAVAGYLAWRSRIPRVGPPPRSGPAVPATATAVRATISPSSALPPLIADVNGDGIADLLLVHRVAGGDSPQHHYGAFDGRNGAELWRSPPLGMAPSGYECRAAVMGRRLLVAGPTGELVGYALADGSKQWTTALGEKLEWYCAGDDPDHAVLVVAGGRLVVLDLRSGAQGPLAGKRACSKVAQTREADTTPRAGDTSGFPDQSVPVHQRSFSCGSTSVMGSVNMFVPDPCPRELGLAQAALGELEPRTIVATGRGWAVVGRRLEGTHSPMVGYVEAKKLVWRSFVHPENPLAAAEGTPEFAVGPAHVVLLYRLTQGNERRATVFAIATGRRAWDGALPAHFSPRRVLATAQVAVAQDTSSVLAVAMADGRVAWRLGDP